MQDYEAMFCCIGNGTNCAYKSMSLYAVVIFYACTCINGLMQVARYLIICTSANDPCTVSETSQTITVGSTQEDCNRIYTMIDTSGS